MTRIEAAARALCRIDPDAMVAPPAHQEVINRTGGRATRIGEAVPAWQLEVHRVHAVLRAIQEPDMEMVRCVGLGNLIPAGHVGLAYVQMIDALLKEKP